MTERETRTAGRRARLFDLRLIIGGMFVLYGLVLTIVGATDSGDQLTRAGGIHINLWLGLGMLALGLAFLLWTRLRPLHDEGPSAARPHRRPHRSHARRPTRRLIAAQ